MSQATLQSRGYEVPEVIDYGSIADHTFSNAGGCGPGKSLTVLARDKCCEYSGHTSGIDQCCCEACNIPGCPNPTCGGNVSC
jgi:hypothetical protein